MYSCFASECREITTQFSDMVLNLADTLQLQMLASHCCNILSDGKAPCKELVLHHTRPVYRCQLQNAANVTRLSLDSISKPMTKILYTDAFTQRYFHKDMFLHRRLHIHMRLPRDGFTHKHLHAQVLYTGVLLHLKLLHRRAGTSKHRCLHTAMLLRNAFARTCFYTGLLLTQSILYTQKLLQ